METGEAAHAGVLDRSKEKRRLSRFRRAGRTPAGGKIAETTTSMARLLLMRHLAATTRQQVRPIARHATAVLGTDRFDGLETFELKVQFGPPALDCLAASA